MLKFTKVALLGAVLTVGLSASDFLAKATNGVVSDMSVGVKQLAIDDMEKVVGGLRFSGIKDISSKEAGVYAELERGKDSDYIVSQFQQGLGAYNIPGYNLAYTVRRDIKVTKYGRYPIFSYSAAAYNEKSNTFHKISSSFVLNNNAVVRQLRDNFKSRLESHLGGW